MAWFTLKATTGYAGSEHSIDFEVPDEDLEGLDEAQREELIEERSQSVLGEIVSWWVEPKEGDDDSAEPEGV